MNSVTSIEECPAIFGWKIQGISQNSAEAGRGFAHLATGTAQGPQSGFRQSVFLEAVLKRAEADAEFAGGAGAVAAVAVESLLDSAALEFVDIEGGGSGGIHGAPFSEREVIGQDFPVAEDGRPFNDVLEFADVAGPAVGAELEAGGVAQAKAGLAELGGGEGDEVFGEGVDVGGAVAERGDFDREGAEAEVEVGAEAAFLDFAVEVAVGGGDDADVGFESLFATEALKAFLLDDAKEFGLEGGVEFADFVEEECAAAGAFEDAVAAGDGSGEGAAFVSEQFAFDQGRGEGGAVDGEEGLLRAAAVNVDAAGDDFLADAAFAEEEDVGGSWGDLAEQVEDVEHAWIAGDHGAAEARRSLAGRGGRGRLGGFGREGEGAADETAQLFRAAEGFFEVVEGASLHGLDGGSDGAESSDEDKGSGGPAFVEELLDFEAVAVGYLEIGNDEREAAAGAGGAGLGEPRGGFNGVAFAF